MINLIGTQWNSPCGSYRYIVCSVVEQDEEEKLVLAIKDVVTDVTQRGFIFMTLDTLLETCQPHEGSE